MAPGLTFVVMFLTVEQHPILMLVEQFVIFSNLCLIEKLIRIIEPKYLKSKRNFDIGNSYQCNSGSIINL